ncbi:hypothetical protein [Mesorhizobium sp. 1B3]|uniref:hypothetical protein n=1 Tax=Mesorhizobium sp. 1B3 TaxID=3243599 RepID=UPI003D99AEBE
MSFRRTAALASLLLVVPLSSAFSQDAAAVGERLKSALSRQGTTLTFDRISGDAARMVVEGATVSIAPEPGEIALGDITLADIKEEAGSLVIGSVTLPNYSTTQEDMTVEATGIGFTNLRFPSEDASDPVAGLLMYDTAAVQNVSVRVGGKQAFVMDRLHFEVDAPVDGRPMTFSGAADKFSADLSLVEDANSRKLIEALDLQTVNGRFDLAGYWQPGDGRLAIEQYDVSIEKAGTLGLTFDFGGYTPDFIKSLQELQKTMAAAPENADNSAQSLAMLGLMQQLTFHSARIRFDDDSLTGKVIDYLAGQQKVKPGDVVNQAKGLLPFLMAQLDNAELTTQTTAAVNTYLDAPKSIEISARPTNPVPFAAIAAGAMSQSPKDLIKMLGVSLTANEPALDDGEAE